MTRRSNSNSTIRLIDSNALTELVQQYRELLELREQVKKAEAAAKRLEPRRQLTTCAGRPVAKVLSRKSITRRSGEFNKRQLYAMLAEAVRNTQCEPCDVRFLESDPRP